MFYDKIMYLFNIHARREKKKLLNYISAQKQVIEDLKKENAIHKAQKTNLKNKVIEILKIVDNIQSCGYDTGEISNKLALFMNLQNGRVTANNYQVERDKKKIERMVDDINHHENKYGVQISIN